MRTVLLHYHLFKNAGTSVDKNLQLNFDERWITGEFPPGREATNAHLVARWIEEHPDVIAFSSHTAEGPVPVLNNTRIISILFLRDPVARIRSAYLFERSQKANTWGAQLAKKCSFQEYVRIRLEKPTDRQCRNFQTFRLAQFKPGPESEIDRACAALSEITVLGFVEHFNASMQHLAAAVAPYFPDFHWMAFHANPQSLSHTLPSNNSDVNALIEDANADDRALLAAARAAHGLSPDGRA